MTQQVFLAAAAACGHVAFWIWIVNVMHGGLGRSERSMNLVKLAALAGLVGIPAWVGCRWAGGGWGELELVSKLYVFGSAFNAVVVVPIATAMLHARRDRDLVRGAVELDPRPHLGLPIHATTRQVAERLRGQGGHSWMLLLPGNESLRLRLTPRNLELPGWPPALDGLSILQISDLHFARSYARDYFEHVFARAAEFESDLVVFTGDLLDDDVVEWVEPLFARLRGRLGQFAILGNHDVEHHPEASQAALGAAGFELLDGAWRLLETERGVLAIGGTAHPWGAPLDFSSAPPSDVRIVLSHTPDKFPRASKAGVHLMLSGHNHGGQIRLPLIGPAFMPSVYSRRFDRGVFRSRRSTLYVSQGVGGKHPLRYGCPPEINRLVLRHAAQPATPAAHAEQRLRGGPTKVAEREGISSRAT